MTEQIVENIDHAIIIKCLKKHYETDNLDIVAVKLRSDLKDINIMKSIMLKYGFSIRDFAFCVYKNFDEVIGKDSLKSIKAMVKIYGDELSI